MMRSLLPAKGALILFAACALAQQPPAPPSAPLAPVAPMDLAQDFFVNNDGNYLGIYIANLTREDRARLNLASAATGVLVTSVAPDSPAARAGVRKDDVIVRLDGEAITNSSKFTRLISEAAPESSLRLTINRAGGEQQLSATLARRENTARLFSDGFKDMPKIDGAEIERRVREAGELNKLRGAFPAIAFGSSRRLGISIVPLTKQLADYFDVKTGRGLLITNVAEDSAAARAGLKAGDVVVEVGTAEIGSTADFTRELNRKQEGEVELKIVRGGRERTIKATPERNSNSSFNFEEFAPEGLFNDGTRLVRPAAPRPVIVPQRRGRIL